MAEAGIKGQGSGANPPQPPFDKGGSKKAGTKAFKKGLRVFKFLGTGDILEWKSVREVARETGLSSNEAYGALEDLVAEGLAEKGDKGFRQSPQGLSFYAVQVQEALTRAVKQLGIPSVRA